MSVIASRITGVSIVCSSVCSPIKENFKASRHWPWWGESTGDRWILLIKDQWRGKCFHLMTSPWDLTMRRLIAKWIDIQTVYLLRYPLQSILEGRDCTMSRGHHILDSCHIKPTILFTVPLLRYWITPITYLFVERRVVPGCSGTRKCWILVSFWCWKSETKIALMLAKI